MTSQQIKITNFIQKAEIQLLKLIAYGYKIDVTVNQQHSLKIIKFIEKFDALFKRSHFVKKSIILLKSWFYYEVSLINSYHQGFSSYAIEIIALSVLNTQSSQINTLDEFMWACFNLLYKLDYENQIITIFGVISKKDYTEVMTISNSVLEQLQCISNKCEAHSVIMDVQTVYEYYNMEKKSFSDRQVGILDPLNLGNNAGKSVGLGAFLRLKSILEEIMQERTKSPRVEAIFKKTCHTLGLNRNSNMEGIEKYESDYLEPSMLI